MKTYTEPKELVENPHYQAQRQKNLTGLTNVMIDVPIVELINDFNKLPYCFTLQCCFGHFLYNGQKDPYNLDILPVTNTITRVKYRIAYIALCVDSNQLGTSLLENLQEITTIDPENIQYFCAEWFWKRQVNSYALQVEPERFKHQDKAILDYKEALKVERIRNEFFIQLKELLRKQQN